MKTKVLFLLTILLTASAIQAQRGVRIGYIDTEYILENIPEYTQAQDQLEKKVQNWKSEIETKLLAIEQKRKALENEKVLLTAELIKEKEEDIFYEEKEVLEYQQNRFGPNGDLMIQKKQLIEPIQDQIFAAVQDIAGTKQFDFIFDKSADVVMLYAAERFDISEQIIRAINRTAKREQASSRKERKELEGEEVVPEVYEGLDERQKALEEKKAKRAAEVEQRRKEIAEARAAKKEAAQKRRDSIIAARKKAKEEKMGNTNTEENENVNPEEENTKEQKVEENNTSTTEEKTREQLLQERKQQRLKDREERRKALQRKKDSILEVRRKAKEDREKEREEEEENENQD